MSIHLRLTTACSSRNSIIIFSSFSSFSSSSSSSSLSLSMYCWASSFPSFFPPHPNFIRNCIVLDKMTVVFRGAAVACVVTSHPTKSTNIQETSRTRVLCHKDNKRAIAERMVMRADSKNGIELLLITRQIIHVGIYIYIYIIYVTVRLYSTMMGYCGWTTTSTSVCFSQNLMMILVEEFVNKRRIVVHGFEQFRIQPWIHLDDR